MAGMEKVVCHESGHPLKGPLSRKNYPVPTSQSSLITCTLLFLKHSIVRSWQVNRSTWVS